MKILCLGTSNPRMNKIGKVPTFMDFVVKCEKDIKEEITCEISLTVWCYGA